MVSPGATRLCDLPLCRCPRSRLLHHPGQNFGCSENKPPRIFQLVLRAALPLSVQPELRQTDARISLVAAGAGGRGEYMLALARLGAGVVPRAACDR